MALPPATSPPLGQPHPSCRPPPPGAILAAVAAAHRAGNAGLGTRGVISHVALRALALPPGRVLLSHVRRRLAPAAAPAERGLERRHVKRVGRRTHRRLPHLLPPASHRASAAHAFLAPIPSLLPLPSPLLTRSAGGADGREIFKGLNGSQLRSITNRRSITTKRNTHEPITKRPKLRRDPSQMQRALALFRSTRGAAPAAARGFQSSAAKSLKLQPEANVEVGTAPAPPCARSAALRLP